MGASYSFQGVLIEPVIYGDVGAWTAWVRPHRGDRRNRHRLAVSGMVCVEEQSRRRATGGVMSKPILVARGVTKVRTWPPAGAGAEGVDLEVREGEFLALVGPSGSGKTTLLNLVGALDVPTAGDLRVLGQQIATLSRRERADLACGRSGSCSRRSISCPC